jgi:NAD(P)-dependent dehydrogenase (short-subunit alcohol dehydrogenase family)
MQDPSLVRIAEAKKISAAQLALKFQMQRGVVVIPQSANPVHQRANLESALLPDLSAEEMKELQATDKNIRFIAGQVFNWKKGMDWHDLWDDLGEATWEGPINGAQAQERPAEGPRRYPARGNRFDGQVAIVTGAAGNFGAVCARMLAAEGARVALVDLDADKLVTVVEEVKSVYGVEVRGYTVDVTKDGDVRAMVERVKAEFGQIDCLFNNAGYQGLFAPMDMYSVEDFDKVMKINVTDVFSVLKHASAIMIQQKRGSIVNTASCAGLGCPTCMPAYASSKAAVAHLTKIAATDLAPSGIRVNSVSPAFIGPEDGFMWKRQVELQAQANPTGAPEFHFSNDPEVVVKQMISSIPLRRLGTPEEVMQGVLFLLSDEASYITGTDLNISGGNMMGGSRG